MNESARGDPEAPPLLLLRPLGGSTRLWGKFRSQLAKHFYVMSFDPPARLTTRAMADDARHVLDQFERKHAHVFGLSLGGMVATELAARWPRRVDRLVLASAPLHGAQIWSSIDLATLAPLVAAFLQPGKAMAESFAEHILTVAFRDAHPDAVREIRRTARKAPGSHLDAAVSLLAAARHDARRIARNIKSPTLVIAGAKDTLLPPAQQRVLSRAIKHAEYAEVKGGGHDLSLEKPEQTARLVTRFLRGLSCSK